MLFERIHSHQVNHFNMTFSIKKIGMKNIWYIFGREQIAHFTGGGLLVRVWNICVQNWHWFTANRLLRSSSLCINRRIYLGLCENHPRTLTCPSVPKQVHIQGWNNTEYGSRQAQFTNWQTGLGGARGDRVGKGLGGERREGWQIEYCVILTDDDPGWSGHLCHLSGDIDWSTGWLLVPVSGTMPPGYRSPGHHTSHTIEPLTDHQVELFLVNTTQEGCAHVCNTLQEEQSVLTRYRP